MTLSNEWSMTHVSEAGPTGRVFLGGEVEAGLEMWAEVGEPGTVTYRAPLRCDVLRPDGSLQPSLLSVMADSATATSVFSALGWSAIGPTVELRVVHLGPPARAATRLDAVGSALTVEGGVGTARVDLRDDLGNPVAYAIGIMAIEQADPVAWRNHESLVRGEFRSADLEVAGVGEGTASARVTPGMTNNHGNIHGGILLALAHDVQDLFLSEIDGEYRRLRLDIDYLRPADPGGPLSFASKHVRSGRRLRTVHTEISDFNGRIVALAAGTSIAVQADVAISTSMKSL